MVNYVLQTTPAKVIEEVAPKVALVVNDLRKQFLSSFFVIMVYNFFDMNFI